MRNYCDGPYVRLAIYGNKLLSALIEVRLGCCRSRARFWLPGVSFWADFAFVLNWFGLWVGLVI